MVNVVLIINVLMQISLSVEINLNKDILGIHVSSHIWDLILKKITMKMTWKIYSIMEKLLDYFFNLGESCLGLVEIYPSLLIIPHSAIAESGNII